MYSMGKLCSVSLLLSLTLNTFTLFALPGQGLAAIDVPNRTVITDKLRIAYATSGEISLYDKAGSNWREITPKPYSVGKIFLNYTSFDPWNDGTLSYVSSSLVNNDTLQVYYKQNLTRAGSGYKNWLLIWETYAKEGPEEAIEIWAILRLDNGTINKITITFPLLGISMGNGWETYYEGVLYSSGTHHFSSYPFGRSIPMIEIAGRANRTGLYAFYFNNTKGIFSYVDAESNWEIPTWTLRGDYVVRLRQSEYFETTHVYLYSETSFVDGFSSSSSYVKASKWYVRNLQLSLSPPMNLEELRSRASNVWINPYAPDWRDQIIYWKDHVSSVGLPFPYDNVGDLNPMNRTRIQEFCSFAHSHNLPVGISIDIMIPTDSQLYIDYSPEFFAYSNKICTGYLPARRYFYNKVAVWAGLGIDWVFLNDVQNNDNFCQSSEHVHDNYFLSYHDFSFLSLMLQAINDNNADDVPHFIWGDFASDNMANFGTLVVSVPEAWGTSMVDFLSHVAIQLYQTDSTKYNLEPTWNGKKWDFNFELEHLTSLATKIYPSWTEAGSSTRKNNIVRNMSIFLSQHVSLYQSQPVVIEEIFPFFVTRIGNNIECVIPADATFSYPGVVNIDDNNIGFASATVDGGRDFVLANKNLTNSVSAYLNDGAYRIPVTLAANETRLVWRRGEVAVSQVENAYASDVSFVSEKLSFNMKSDSKVAAVAKVFVSGKGKPSKVSVNNNEFPEGVTWHYDSNSKTVAITWANFSTATVKLEWPTSEIITAVVNALPYFVAIIIVLIGAMVYLRRKTRAPVEKGQAPSKPTQ